MIKIRKTNWQKSAYLKSKCVLSLQIHKNTRLMNFLNTTIKKGQMIKILQILCCTNLLYFFNYLSSFKVLKNEDITFSRYVFWCWNSMAFTKVRLVSNDYPHWLWILWRKTKIDAPSKKYNYTYRKHSYFLDLNILITVVYSFVTSASCCIWLWYFTFPSLRSNKQGC